MKKNFLWFFLFALLALPFAHAVPVMNSSTITATNYNRTLIASANATESLNVNVTYYYTLFLNDTRIQNGSGGGYGSYSPNITRNFLNISLDAVDDDGTYILEVIAGNGTVNTTALNSSGLSLTFPRTPDDIALSRSLNIFILALVVSIALGFFGMVAPEYKQYVFMIWGFVMFILIAALL